MDNHRQQANLKVTIVKAEGLCKRSFFKYPDPFAVITINGEQTHSTHPCISTLSPFWNVSYEFLVNERSTVNVQIFDQRKYMKDHQGFLGLVAIRVSSVIDIRRKMSRSITAPLTSSSSSESVRGTITVLLSTDFVPSRPMSAGPSTQPAIPTNHSSPGLPISNQKGQMVLSSSLADEQGALPPGWERRIDQFGRTYYVDHNTRTTSWTRPPVDMAPAEIEQRQRDILNEQRLQIERRTLPSAPNRSLANESINLSLPAGPAIIKVRPEDFEAFVRDSVKRLGDLPDGFDIRLDDSGRVYFADHIHQTTSWDDPRLPSSADASAPAYQRDFQRKLTFFRSQPEMRLRKGKVNIDIRRESVFEDSYDRIMKMSSEELKQRLNIRFDGEEGLDYGGVAREFFFLLSHEIFSPAYCLFEYSSHANYTLQISPRSNINPEHLDYFRFIGRVIGLAIFHQKFVDAFFVTSFYKQILGMEINLEDMESVDADVYKNLQWILDNDVDDLGTFFAVDDDQFGVIVEEDLIPNGRNIPVTNENKSDYVDLLVKWRIVNRVQEQMKAFLAGLFDIIPRSLLTIFDDREMELLIGGIAEIDVDDWIANSVYRDCTADDQLVKWFWKCIKENFDDERRARLLQFTTGTSRVPVNGFKDLQGSDGPRKFCIQKMVGWNVKSLPKSHTCFNRIDLPPYTSYEDLVEKLTMAIEETIGFAQE